MGLYFDQQQQEDQFRPRRGLAAGTFDPSSGYVDSAPLFVDLYKEGWAVQPVQPPALRFWQRIGGAMRGDDGGFGDFASPLKVPPVEGWRVQDFQPQYPFNPNGSSPRPQAGALARGDDGIYGIFVPPWAFAKPNLSFPDVQSDVRAATPSYDAGAQVGAIKSQPNIYQPTLLKAAPGYVFSLVVNTAGSAPGTINDCTTIGAASAANQVAPIPNTTGVYKLDWPFQNGIVIVPGTGQVIAAKWT